MVWLLGHRQTKGAVNGDAKPNATAPRLDSTRRDAPITLENAMPLTEDEIAPGVVAYFDPTILHADDKVGVTGDPVTRDGPFLCYASGDGFSRWTPLTSEDKLIFNRRTGQNHSVRVRIKPEWVAGAFGLFTQGESFLQDGKNTYSGPNATFVTAAAVIDTQTPVTRPALTAEGLRA